MSGSNHPVGVPPESDHAVVAETFGQASPARARALERLLSPYTLARKLSGRQHRVFRLYLEGKADKEIAEVLGCAVATVYEHWRRMARKAGGHHKSDAISDFHQFLGELVG